MAITSDTAAATASGSRWVLAPQRELRLLVEGIRDWLTSLGDPAKAAQFIGVLEGDAGQGQPEILEALHRVCIELKLNVVLSAGWPLCSVPPCRAADLVRAAVRGVTLERAPPADNPGAPHGFISAEAAREVNRTAAGANLAEIEEGSSLGAEEDELRLMDGLADALYESACAAPLILLVEDLHDADPLTQEVLRRLTGMVARRRQRPQMPRLLLLVTARPGGDLQRVLGHVDVQVGELEAFRVVARGYSREDLKDLSAAVLGEELPLSLREHLHRLTLGNSRHLRWLLASLKSSPELRVRLEAGVGTESAWTQSALRQRQALAPAEGKLIDILALLQGPCASEVALEALALLTTPGTDAAGLPTSALERLQSLGWLRCTRSPERPAAPATEDGPAQRREELGIADYELAAVIGDAVPPPERARMHGVLADLLEKHAEGSARSSPRVVVHLCAAGREERIAPATFAACRYLRAIGCTAAALELTEQALSSLRGSQPPELVRLRANLLRETGNYREAAEAHEVLLERAPQGAARAELLRILAELHRELEEHEARADCIERGLEETESMPDSAERIALLVARAQLRLEAGDPSGSFEVLEECLRHVAQQDDKHRGACLEVYRVAERIHHSRGNYREAIELKRATLQLAEARGDVCLQLESLHHLAELHELLSEWTEAEVHLVRATTVAKRSGSRSLWVRSLCYLGRHQRDRGDAAAALQSFRHSLSVAVDICDGDAICMAGCELLAIELEAGRFDRAARTARFLVQMDLVAWLDSHHTREAIAGNAARSRTSARPGERARRLRRCLKVAGGARGTASDWLQVGQLFELEGKLAEAQRAYREAIQRSGGKESWVRTHAFLCLGRVARLRGTFETALQCFEQSLGSLGARPNRELLAEIYLEASRVLAERGDLARAFEYGGRGLRAGLDARSSRLVALALLVTGHALGETGVLSPAVELLTAAGEMARRMGHQEMELDAHVAVLHTRVQEGASDAASEPDHNAARVARELGLPVSLCHHGVARAWESYRRADFETAAKLAREGIELARQTGLTPALNELLHLLGLVESDPRNQRKNLLRALELLAQSLAGAESMPCPRLTWEVLHDMATIYRARGKESLADEYERKATETAALCLGTLTGPLRELRWPVRSLGREAARAKEFQIRVPAV